MEKAELIKQVAKKFDLSEEQVEEVFSELLIAFGKIKEAFMDIWERIKPLAIYFEEEIDVPQFEYKWIYPLVLDTCKISQVTMNKPRFIVRKII